MQLLNFSTGLCSFPFPFSLSVGKLYHVWAEVVYSVYGTLFAQLGASSYFVSPKHRSTAVPQLRPPTLGRPRDFSNGSALYRR